jgi:hypothetical protein
MHMNMDRCTDADTVMNSETDMDETRTFGDKRILDMYNY